MVDMDHGLCGACWRDTQFVGAPVCQSCGTPLPGGPDAQEAQCDTCLRVARPWLAGRSALIYAGNGRKLVLGLKHGDRLDVVGPAASWMVRAASDMIDADLVVVAVPLHWRRRIYRRYNQSVLLARGVAKEAGLTLLPDALLRPRATPVLDGMGPQARHQAVSGSITINPVRADVIRGRPVLLVDDVMTTGATLSAATQALQTAGSGPVSVLKLARAVKDA